MSRPDVLAGLRTVRPGAPPELRERVRAITLTAAAPRSRRRLLPPRRALAVLLAAAIATAAALGIAVGVSDRGSSPERATVRAAATQAEAAPQHAAGTLDRAAVPAPSRTRLQDYDATLSLRVRNAAAVSAVTKRALGIVRSLGGFASVVDVNADGAGGDATLRVRVPVAHVQDALRRLSALGRVTGERVAIQDRQAGVNATDRRIARLQRQLRALRRHQRTDRIERRIASLTAQVQKLQRSRASAVRQARLATISLRLTTRVPAAPAKPVHHGPLHQALHGAVVALTWLGVGLLYALVVGGPVVLLVAAAWLGARALRRRNERRLLERR